MGACALVSFRFPIPMTELNELNVVAILLKDHAAGSLLVEEAGGVITHFNGERLDFGLGRTLGTNYGIVAAGKDVHGRVLEAIKQANANGVN